MEVIVNYSMLNVNKVKITTTKVVVRVYISML